MEIPIIILAVCLMAMCVWFYLFRDKLLDIMAGLATIAEDHKKKLDVAEAELAEIHEKLEVAEELIEAAKELTEEQKKSEKLFQDGFNSIINY